MSVTTQPADARLVPPRHLGGWFGALASTDHKRIGSNLFIASFVFFLGGGVMALLMRGQLAEPSGTDPQRGMLCACIFPNSIAARRAGRTRRRRGEVDPRSRRWYATAAENATPLVRQRTGRMTTGDMSTETGGRPAALFRFRREVLAERPAAGLRFGGRG